MKNTEQTVSAIIAAEQAVRGNAPRRYTREELESDEAFAAAEAVLRGEFGEPTHEEKWADVYGGIIEAVLHDLDAEARS